MNVRSGASDILSALKNVRLPLFLAQSDIRQRYRRSTLGPFWITISTGVMIACIGLIFGRLFKSNNAEFLPFLASGLILWAFISSTLIDATNVFSESQAIIKQLPIPLFSHVLRMIARNFYIFLHNVLIIPLVLLVVHKEVGFNSLYFIPGVVLLLCNLTWMSLLLGIVCTRFRDITQIVTSCLQIAFYVTPIIWMPSLLPARTSVMVLEPNPFYHLLQIVRAPFMNEAPTIMNWLYSFLFLLIGWVVTIMFYNKYKKRIAYWL